jgi:holliday junction DNA helicase RuvA
MLVYIKGAVLHQGVGYLIVEHRGLGYKISFPEQVVHEMRGGVELYLHEVIRDSERELFGFTSIEQLELFWKLIAISGVGPRGAQKIIYADHIARVKAKIMEGNLTFLTDVPGIGKKTVQKIILELKGVLADEPSVTVIDSDAIDALMGLGYSKRDAEIALSGIEEGSTEDRIRTALKGMAK